jgi:hypothetical protein
MRKSIKILGSVIGIIFILGGLVREVIEVPTIVLGIMIIFFTVIYSRIDSVHEELQDFRKEVRKLTSSSIDSDSDKAHKEE